MPATSYKIGEAAKLLQLQSFTLRFWETEFPQLRPGRTEKGQRLYSEADLELLRRIRHLLHERGLTIEGARKILQGRSESFPPAPPGQPAQDDEFADLGEGPGKPLQGILVQPSRPAAPFPSGQAEARGVLSRTLEELRGISALLRRGGPTA
ncbi:MAG: MerR family transcriptional regulator [Desulfovibrionaceae bacterium]|nr:MerR family transcriptional regulator [Desulfovibrionaceae bacterium]